MNKIRILHFLGQGVLGGQQQAQFFAIQALSQQNEFKIGVALGQEKRIFIEKLKKLDVDIIQLNIKSGFQLNFKLSVLKRFKE